MTVEIGGTVGGPSREIGCYQLPPEKALWLEGEFKPFINPGQLEKRVKRDPWALQIRSTLANYLRLVNRYEYFNFKVHGRMLLSASQILRVQSNHVVQASAAAQEDIIQFESEGTLAGGFDEFDSDPREGGPSLDEAGFNRGFELEPDDYSFPGESWDHPGAGKDSSSRDSVFSNFFALVDSGAESNATLTPAGNAGPLGSASVLNGGKPRATRCLAQPRRLPYRKITFAELATALKDVLVRTSRKRPGGTSRKFSKEFPVLPTNLLQKAEEERARNEHLRKRIYERIVELSGDAPVSFLDLVVEPTPLGIVRTLLSILHLVNRKKIDLFQEQGDGGAGSSTGAVFIAPAGKFDPNLGDED
ncbi:MAG: hypothetical protein ACTSU5_16075 [Promethearchaeota archaeon]